MNTYDLYSKACNMNSTYMYLIHLAGHKIELHTSFYNSVHQGWQHKIIILSECTSVMSGLRISQITTNAITLGCYMVLHVLHKGGDVT